MKYFEGKELFEWSTRSVSREEWNIKENNEVINVISNIYKGNGILSTNLPHPVNCEFEGVLTEIDINTIMESSEYRIDSQFIEQFYEKALLTKKELEGCEESV